MRLPRRNREPRTSAAEAAVTAAQTAGKEAGERLASASEVRAGADAQAAREQRTIIADLRAMRERNNLAALVLGSMRQGEGP